MVNMLALYQEYDTRSDNTVIEREINNLVQKKSTPQNDVAIIKSNADLVSPLITLSQKVLMKALETPFSWKIEICRHLSSS